VLTIRILDITFQMAISLSYHTCMMRLMDCCLFHFCCCCCCFCFF